MVNSRENEIMLTKKQESFLIKSTDYVDRSLDLSVFRESYSDKFRAECWNLLCKLDIIITDQNYTDRDRREINRFIDYYLDIKYTVGNNDEQLQF